jgi:hypothetical protein
MRFASALPLVGILSLTLPAFATADSQGCSTLKSKLSDSVFYPNSSVYKDESTNFWSNTEIMSPACVFRPASAADLGKGIRLLTKKNAKFAVRGGGHMGIRVRIIVTAEI